VRPIRGAIPNDSPTIAWAAGVAGREFGPGQHYRVRRKLRRDSAQDPAAIRDLGSVALEEHDRNSRMETFGPSVKKICRLRSGVAEVCRWWHVHKDLIFKSLQICVPLRPHTGEVVHNHPARLLEATETGAQPMN
jgi:hypothetical protein